MSINSPHKRNKNYARVRDGLSLIRSSSGAKTRRELVKSRASLEGVSLRGAKKARKSLDKRMRNRKRNYALNRVGG